MTLGKCINNLKNRQIDENLSQSKSFNDSLNLSNKSIEKKLHVPYRDSKLTMLLQNSLSGKSYLALIVTISPDDINVEESFSSLRFASGAM